MKKKYEAFIRCKHDGQSFYVSAEFHTKSQALRWIGGGAIKMNNQLFSIYKSDFFIESHINAYKGTFFLQWSYWKYFKNGVAYEQV